MISVATTLSLELSYDCCRIERSFYRELKSAGYDCLRLEMRHDTLLARSHLMQTAQIGEVFGSRRTHTK